MESRYKFSQMYSNKLHNTILFITLAPQAMQDTRGPECRNHWHVASGLDPDSQRIVEDLFRQVSLAHSD